jgi:sporulation protein YlmC with PRC-barrel domain
MPKTQLFRLGADVCCADGECGKLSSLVISPGDDVVTHLVVEQSSRRAPGRLVPLGLVDAEPPARTGEPIRLDCTTTEFGTLDPAEATYIYPDNEEYQVRPGASTASGPDYAPPGVMGAPGLPGQPGDKQEFTVDIIPEQLPGESEISPSQPVHAKDGDVGRVQGIAVDPATGLVASVLLRTGHLWNRKAVLIPRSAVAAVDADGFHLNITARQVHDLPPADLDHPAG